MEAKMTHFWGKILVENTGEKIEHNINSGAQY